MKRIKFFALSFGVFLTIAPLCLAQENFEARISGVVSGDTVTIMTKDRRQLMIQLTGIDAPENEQEYGTISREFLSNLILNQSVAVSNMKKDCANRLRASLAFNKKDLSLLAVKTGNAWADVACEPNDALSKEQSTAKDKKFGLWENADAINPSEFVEKNHQMQNRATVSQTDNRRIFSNLAPTPPPILTPAGKPSGIYIGMSVDDFTRICGAGERSSLYSSESYQSFDIKVAGTKNNSEKGCGGSFNFNKSGSNSDFKLSSAIQDL